MGRKEKIVPKKMTRLANIVFKGGPRTGLFVSHVGLVLFVFTTVKMVLI